MANDRNSPAAIYGIFFCRSFSSFVLDIINVVIVIAINSYTQCIKNWSVHLSNCLPFTKGKLHLWIFLLITHSLTFQMYARDSRARDYNLLILSKLNTLKCSTLCPILLRAVYGISLTMVMWLDWLCNSKWRKNSKDEKEEEEETKTTEQKRHCHLAIYKKIDSFAYIFAEYRCTCVIFFSSPSFCFDLHSIYTYVH